MTQALKTDAVDYLRRFKPEALSGDLDPFAPMDDFEDETPEPEEYSIVG